jgi:hypothetical protein
MGRQIVEDGLETLTLGVGTIDQIAHPGRKVDGVLALTLIH